MTIPRGLTEVQKMWNWHRQNISYSFVHRAFHVRIWGNCHGSLLGKLSTASCQWLLFNHVPSAIKLWKSYCSVNTRGLVKWGGDTWVSHSDHLIENPLRVVAVSFIKVKQPLLAHSAIFRMCVTFVLTKIICLFYISSYMFPLKRFYFYK